MCFECGDGHECDCCRGSEDEGRTPCTDPDIGLPPTNEGTLTQICQWWALFRPLCELADKRQGGRQSVSDAETPCELVPVYGDRRFGLIGKCPERVVGQLRIRSETATAGRDQDVTPGIDGDRVGGQDRRVSDKAGRLEASGVEDRYPLFHQGRINDVNRARSAGERLADGDMGVFDRDREVVFQSEGCRPPQFCDALVGESNFKATYLRCRNEDHDFVAGVEIGRVRRHQGHALFGCQGELDWLSGDREHCIEAPGHQKSPVMRWMRLALPPSSIA